MTATRNTTRRPGLPAVAGAFALVASAFLCGVAVFGEANSGCPTSADCDTRCGKAPTLDGTIESIRRHKKWLDCRTNCTLEAFNCRFPSPGGGSGSFEIPDDDVPTRGDFVRPDLLADDLSMVLIERESTISSADTNGDGMVDVSDASRLLNYLFLGGAAPVGVLANGLGDPENEPQRSPDGRQLVFEGDVALSSGDTDGNGRLDIADAVVILRFLFGGGEAPLDILFRRVQTLPPPPPTRPVPPIFPPVFER